MLDSTEPWIEGEVKTRNDIERVVARTNPHLYETAELYQTQVRYHAWLHLMGRAETPEHTKCVEDWEHYETQLIRGTDGLWC